MDALNSVESKKMSPSQSMAHLEKVINVADQRLRMRRDIAAKASVTLGFLDAIPLSSYMLYHLFAPSGVMQNHKASSGAYLYWMQNFMYKGKSQTAIYRPEFNFKETSSSLFRYT